jgi:predicted MFS family arabinose efflux permease
LHYKSVCVKRDSACPKECHWNYLEAIDQSLHVLLVFGIASLISIWITGVLIDRHLRILMVTSCALFALAVLALGILAAAPAAVFISAALWGLAFGGAASLLQTAGAAAAGPAADIVQPVMVTGWNVGIAGGLLLGGMGASSLAWATWHSS